jgi:hypothetical protein
MRKKLKNILLPVISILIVMDASAQFFDKPLLYLSTEIDVGNYWGVNANVNYVLKNRYSLQVGYSGHIKTAKSLPEDFDGGMFDPYESFENIQLLVGRVVDLNAEGTIRLNFLGGVGYTFLREPINFQPDPHAGGFFDFGDNYDYDYDRRSVASIILNPKIEFPFTRVFGFTFSVLMQYNKERTFVGFGVGQILGKLH